MLAPRIPSLLPAGLLSIATLALLACGTTTKYTPTNPSPSQMVPKAADAVHVFTTAKPDRPFVEVGILQSRQASIISVHDMPDIIQHMRAEAGSIGCDAVLIHGVDNKTTTQVNHLGKAIETLEGFWGACLVYTGLPHPKVAITSQTP